MIDAHEGGGFGDGGRVRAVDPGGATGETE